MEDGQKFNSPKNILLKLYNTNFTVLNWLVYIVSSNTLGRLELNVTPSLLSQTPLPLFSSTAVLTVVQAGTVLETCTIS